MRRSDEQGSLLLALLLSIAVSGLLAASLVTLRQSSREVRSDRAFTFAIQVADAGLNQALQFVNNAPEGTTSLTSDDVVGVGNTADTALRNENFSWTAEWDATAREWELTATSTVDGRTRRIEASASKIGIFQTGAFADDYLAFTSNHVADSYPIENVGSIGSNNTIIIDNNAEPDVVVIAGDATCTQGNETCEGETNQGHSYLIQPSNRFDIAAITTMIDEDISANCPGAADLEPVTFATEAELTAYFSGGGVFCFSQLTIGWAGLPVSWQPDAETVIYVTGDVNIGNGARLNCTGCNAGGGTLPNAYLLQMYTQGDVTLGNQSELGFAVAAPEGACGPGGQSSAGTHVYGSMICNELDNQGGWAFHYDTRLLSLGAETYSITRWREEVGDSTSFE